MRWRGDRGLRLALVMALTARATSSRRRRIRASARASDIVISVVDQPEGWCSRWAMGTPGPRYVVEGNGTPAGGAFKLIIPSEDRPNVAGDGGRRNPERLGEADLCATVQALLSD